MPLHGSALHGVGGAGSASFVLAAAMPTPPPPARRGAPTEDTLQVFHFEKSGQLQDKRTPYHQQGSSHWAEPVLLRTSFSLLRS